MDTALGARPGAGRVTISDVARAAGVSIPTVSKVINQRDGVAPATMLRVQQVVEELGYETSLVARSLRSSRTGVVVDMQRHRLPLRRACQVLHSVVNRYR